MSSRQPDLEHDVIVQHVPGATGRADHWAVFLGRDQRTSVDNSQTAMVFARLLADLQQRRIWVRHGLEGDLRPLDTSQLRGCSCC
jgi:hypothetical protein